MPTPRGSIWEVATSSPPLKPGLRRRHAGAPAAWATAALLAACGGSGGEDVLAVPRDSVAGSTFVEVSGAFVRRIDDRMELYFSLTNHEEGADRVLAVATAAATSVTILGVDGPCDNDTADVRAAAFLAVPGEDSVVLRPGGCRVVLDGVAADATSIPVTLMLAGGLSLQFDVPVKGA